MGIQSRIPAYCFTFFSEHLAREKERAQARIWGRRRSIRISNTSSTIVKDMRKWVPLKDNRMPTDKYRVPPFDAKGKANQSSPISTC
jgi:hypothetical protein